MTPSNTFWNIYKPVFVIAVISVFGLVSALLGDGLWDRLSWIAMAVPLAVITWHCGKGQNAKRKLKAGRVE